MDQWNDICRFGSRLDGIRKEIEKERRELSKRKPPSMATAQNASHKHRENALRYIFIKFLTDLAI